MKKKLLSLILTVVMAGVLAGCAEKAPAGAQSQTTGNGEMETGKWNRPEIFGSTKPGRVAHHHGTGACAE